jgi:acetyltransferase EpsM
MRDLIIIGAGGHAKVIFDIATAQGFNVLGFLDDNPKSTKLFELERLGEVKDCLKFCNDAEFVIAIGNNEIRKRISEEYPLRYATLIHPSAVISPKATIGEGTVVMPVCVVNSPAKIGRHCIINTAAVVEHDNIIGDFTHLSPRSALCGTVKVGEMCHIGSGAVVIHNKTICDKCIIGAGATVVDDITECGTYVGTPAKRIK